MASKRKTWTGRVYLGQDGDGNVVRRAGVMGVVLHGGAVRPGDPLVVELPPGPHEPLERERLWLAQAHSTVGGPCRIREGQ